VVVSEGDLFNEVHEFYQARGVTNRIRAVVLVKIERALPPMSPA